MFTIKEFDADLFFMIVEKMTVFEGQMIILTLLGSTYVIPVFSRVNESIKHIRYQNKKILNLCKNIVKLL